VRNLNHLWQRFLLASTLLIGLAIGVIATVFGYSNLATVDVHWSVFHINGVPLWTVAVVPIALVLIAGTVYHWVDGLHHFTEHMHHRHRVHELEAEVASLRAHLDQVLEMPDHSGLPVKGQDRASLPQPEEDAMESTPVGDAPAEVAPQPEPESVPRGSGSERTKRVKLAVAAEPAAAQANGKEAPEPAEPADNPEPAAPAAGA
jgi:hypothetical protein